MALSQITPPVREPVSLDYAKTHCRVDGTDEDNLIAGLIISARAYCEKYINRALMEQTWDLWLDKFPKGGAIEIPLPPLQTVTSIKYYDIDDTEHTMDAADYIVDAASEPGRVVLGYSKAWSTTTLRPVKAVCVRFVAGYATYSSTVTTAGTAVTKTAGDDFDTTCPEGKLITINGTTYRVASVKSTSELTLATTAGEQEDITMTANDVPETVIQAMLLLIGHWYRNREAADTGGVSKEIEFAVKNLLWLDKVVPV